MSGPNGHQYASKTRFQIASRLGGFRDTAILTDPFGTGAKFHVRRKGCEAHKRWGKEWLENDPLTHALLEEQILGEPILVLTKEEEDILSASREGASTETDKLLSIINRLVSDKQDLLQSRTAVKRAIDSKAVSLVDATLMGQDNRRQTDEAVFLLSWWDNLPDADGNPIPHDPSVVRELLENDTPLDGAGLDDILLSMECWTVNITGESATLAGVPHGAQIVPAAGGKEARGKEGNGKGEDGITSPKYTYTLKLIRPGLTLGRAYVLWLHHVSAITSNFRDTLVEEAAKNSAPSSEISTSSGDGTSNAEPANF